jgi:hypothetical protein
MASCEDLDRAGQGEPSDGILSRPEQSKRPRPGWYRGVKLQPPVAPPQMPLHVLQEAVEHAVRKNEPTLARYGGEN